MNNVDTIIYKLKEACSFSHPLVSFTLHVVSTGVRIVGTWYVKDSSCVYPKAYCAERTVTYEDIRYSHKNPLVRHINNIIRESEDHAGDTRV